MENTKIEWANHTFNPWMGCTKVSPACKFCYAERDMDNRLRKVQWGPNGTRVVTSDANWKNPIKWNNAASDLPSRIVKPHSRPIEYVPVPRPRVFCASLADVFEDWDGPILNHSGQRLWHSYTIGEWTTEQPIGFGTNVRGPVTMDDVRSRLFTLIDATPHLDWLLLTKRPENIPRMWPTESDGEGGKLAEAIYGHPGKLVRRRDNVWLGTSVENQEQAENRITYLLDCRNLSPVLFLSCEPLLGPLDLMATENVTDIAPDGTVTKSERKFMEVDWVIAGGESGPNARPSHPEWFLSLRNQCQSANVPFHFKQWGEYRPWASDGSDAGSSGWWINTIGKGFEKTTPFTEPGYALMARAGKKAAGRLLDGVTHDGFPYKDN